MKQLKSHVMHEDPDIMSISHIHVLLLSSAISLIVSLPLPSWSPVVVLKLPIGKKGTGGVWRPITRAARRDIASGSEVISTPGSQPDLKESPR